MIIVNINLIEDFDALTVAWRESAARNKIIELCLKHEQKRHKANQKVCSPLYCLTFSPPSLREKHMKDSFFAASIVLQRENQYHLSLLA